MSTTPLSSSDTFQTWFNTTNSIISEINGITVHNILPGDGISLTSSGNVFTIKHGSSVGTPVTFTGPVSFTNTVSFSTTPSLNTVTLDISPKTSGITIGNVVRIINSGLTLSRANNAENSEVLGIVVGSGASYDRVATSGVVDNTAFSNTISNLLGVNGGTLSVGCAYFLSPEVAGGITSFEPVVYGTVSKPVLLGVTGSSGVILPYRGIQIEGISAGITSELDNKVIIQVDYTTQFTPAISSGYFSQVKKGDPILYYGENTDTGILQQLLLDNGNYKLIGYLNGGSTRAGCQNIVIYNIGSTFNVTTASVLGVVSNILNDTGTSLILEVATKGGSFNVKQSELDTNLYSFTNSSDGYTAKGGIFKYNLSTNLFEPIQASSNPVTSFATLVPFNDAEQTIRFTYNGTEYITEDATVSSILGSQVGSVNNGITGSLEYDNLIPNGSFTIWQRAFNGLNGVTLAGLSAFNTPIADRWFYMADSAGNLVGLTATVQKQSFDASQIVVPGSPRYWVETKQSYSSAAGLNYRPRLENIQRGARLLQGQQATITFWAYAGICGATMNLVYNQYEDNTAYGVINDASDAVAARTSIASGVALNTVWNQYSYTFTTNAQGAVSGDTEEGWYGIGFEFPGSGVTLAIAQVKLELGSDVADYVYEYPETVLEKCKPYYFRTYDWDQSTGYTGTSRLNEQYLPLGNLLSQDIYDVAFSVEMVQTPTVTLYSPTGEPNEAYNVTKKADMRYPRCEGCPIHVNLPWDTSTVRTSSPSGNITVPNTTKNGMQLKINNGATHLDVLKFHYVADADIKIKTL